jgi:hypothetical protein
MFGSLTYFSYLYEVKRERVGENPQSSSIINNQQKVKGFPKFHKVMKNQIKFSEVTKFNQSFKVRYESVNGVQYVSVTPEFKNKTQDQWGMEIGISNGFQTKRGAPLTDQQILNKVEKSINEMVKDRTYIQCKENNQQLSK